jgi:excisionase family DNA binding protein
LSEPLELSPEARAQASTKLIYKLVTAGDLPAIRYGRLVRFRLEDVERWERGQVAGTLR